MSADMSGLTLPSYGIGGKEVTPLEIFLTIGPWALGFVWTCKAEFAGAPSGARELDQVSQTGELISCMRLVELLATGVQIVDGDLLGQPRSHDAARIAVTSVRGEEWDVRSSSSELLEAVLSHFELATRLPD